MIYVSLVLYALGAASMATWADDIGADNSWTSFFGVILWPIVIAVCFLLAIVDWVKEKVSP